MEDYKPNSGTGLVSLDCITGDNLDSNVGNNSSSYSIDTTDGQEETSVIVRSEGYFDPESLIPKTSRNHPGLKNDEI